MRLRPAGADNFLKWRRTIDEHLELRRMTWDEYAMFSWLCTKASPRTGSLRTSWPTLGEQTGLTPNHVEKLCRALKRKRYVWYPAHRGARGRLVDVGIHKYPLAQGTYTDLSARFAAEVSADVPADVQANVHGSAPYPTRRRAEVLAEVPAELAGKTVATSRGSPRGRPRSDREREIDRDGRAGARDARAGQLPPRGEAIATPVAIGDLLASQPWWRPSADGPPSPTGTEAGAVVAGEGDDAMSPVRTSPRAGRRHPPWHDWRFEVVPREGGQDWPRDCPGDAQWRAMAARTARAETVAAHRRMTRDHPTPRDREASP